MRRASPTKRNSHATFCGLLIIMLAGEVAPLGWHKLGMPFALGPVLAGSTVAFLVGIAVFVVGIVRSVRAHASRRVADIGAALTAGGLGVFLGAALVNALNWAPTGGPVIRNPGLDFAVPSVLLFTATVSYLLTLVNFMVVPTDKSR